MCMLLLLGASACIPVEKFELPWLLMLSLLTVLLSWVLSLSWLTERLWLTGLLKLFQIFSSKFKATILDKAQNISIKWIDVLDLDSSVGSRVKTKKQGKGGKWNHQIFSNLSIFSVKRKSKQKVYFSTSAVKKGCQFYYYLNCYFPYELPF